MTQTSQDPSNTTVTGQSSDLPKVSAKQKKGEIISAYQELLERFKSNAEKSKEREKDTTRKQETGVLSKATQYSTEAIVKKIGELEMSTHEWLGKLVDALEKEAQKFRDLQGAVQIQENRLKEIHQIELEANTLSNIIEAQREKTNEFEEEIAERKMEWDMEQKEFEYARNLGRRKEEDEYREKEASKIAELKEWENRLKETEVELKELRAFKEEADARLAEAVKAAQEETSFAVRREEEVRAQLLAEKVNSDKQITEHTIHYLKERLSELENTINRLKAELEIANKGVKDIAIKVIEGGRLEEQHRGIRVPMKEKQEVEEAA